MKIPFQDFCVALLFLCSGLNLHAESLPSWVYVASTNEFGGFRFCSLDLRNNDVLVAGSFNAARGYVMRFDDAGKPLWRVEASATVPGSGLVCGGLDVDPGGNALVLFQFNGILSFGSQTFTNGNSNKGFVVAKVDPTGSVKWGRMVLGSLVVDSYRRGQLRTDADGNVYAFADHTELLVVSSEGGSLRSNADPFGKTTFIRFSPTGVPEWIRGIESGGAQGYVRVDSFAVNSDAIFVTGFFNKAVNWGGTNITALVPSGFIGRMARSSGTPHWIHGTGPSAQGSEVITVGVDSIWSNIRRLNGATLHILRTNGTLVLSKEGPHASSKLRNLSSGDVLAAGLSPNMFARYAPDGSLLYSAANIGSNSLAVVNGIGCDVNMSGDFYFLGNRTNQFGPLALAKVGAPGLFPEILRHPTSATNQPGTFSSFGMSVHAMGAQPLTYQWRHDGVPIPGANDTNYLHLNALPADSGNYDCWVSNRHGVVISQRHPVRVSPPVQISQSPQPQLVLSPGTILTGSSILGTDVSTGSLAGKTLSFTITNSASGWPDAGQFDFRFRNTTAIGGTYEFPPGGVFGSPAGTHLISFQGPGALYLVLNRFPANPTNSTLFLYSQGLFSLETTPVGNRGTSKGVFTIRGGTNQAQFSVNGNPQAGTAFLSYQWQKDGQDLDGATNSVLLLTGVGPSHDGFYRCVITAYNGDRSASATVTTVEARLHVAGFGTEPTKTLLGFYPTGAGGSDAALALTWPAGWRLQRNPGLDPAGWVDVIGSSPKSVSALERAEFFRLVGP